MIMLCIFNLQFVYGMPVVTILTMPLPQFFSHQTVISNAVTPSHRSHLWLYCEQLVLCVCSETSSVLMSSVPML